jgi:tetratricopeptide (TPR) repeat protein
MHSSRELNIHKAKPGVVRTCCILLAIYLFLISPSVLAVDQKSASPRTFKLKVVIDENYRKRSSRVFEIKRWVENALRFFKKNFSLVMQVHQWEYWYSDNMRGSLDDLMADFYSKVRRGDCDIVVGYTDQIPDRADLSGVASYRYGYILLRRRKNDYVNRAILVHELCHLFGAIDVTEGSSIMNKYEPRLVHDEFTARIIQLHKNRRFSASLFPLSSEDMESAIILYNQKRELEGSQAEISIMLAQIYIEKRDYEKAIQECLEAERLEPDNPAVRGLLEIARQKHP